MEFTPQDRRSVVSAALVTLAKRTSGDLNPYLRRHLSGHVAAPHLRREAGRGASGGQGRIRLQV